MLLPALPTPAAAGGEGPADSSPLLPPLQPLSLEETLQAVATPPTGRNLGPRVEHVQVAAAGLLSEAVASALELPQWFVLELIRFGAVHYCPVMPQPSPKAVPRMSAQHLERMQQLRAAGIARHGRSPKLAVPQRITGPDCHVEEGGYIRVHVHPKRFPAAYAVDWRQAVVADGPEYVVVDKPAGVQVPPTVDNVLESVVARTAAALGLPLDAVSNTHRLDVGTSGILVLAKGPGFAAWFSRLLSHKPGALVKTYRCLSAAPPPLGRMVHWAVVRQRAAGEPAHTRVLLGAAAGAAGAGGAGGDAAAAIADADAGGSAAGDAEVAQAAVEGAVRCELIVEQVQQVALTGAAAAEWGLAAYETTLQLVTGRTHQIRAQMAAVGCPLLGDQLYTALSHMWQQEQQEQQQEQLAQGQEQPGRCQQQDESTQPHQQQQGGGAAADDADGPAQHRHAGAQWSKVYQEDPSRPIGLQAARLKVRNAGGRMTAPAAAQPEPEPEQPLLQPADGVVDDAAGTEQVLLLRQRRERGSRKKTKKGGAGDEGVVPGESGAEAEREPPPPGEPEWVEFEAGTPWWRA